MIKQILLVGAGGAAGSILRYLTSFYIGGSFNVSSFPIGTFIVNIVGCFCVGLLSTILPSNNLRLLLIVGFCGGFTTFSSFANETVGLMNGGQQLLAFAYTLLSCILGISAVWLGMYVSK